MNYPKASLFSPLTPPVYKALNQGVKLVTTGKEKTVIAEFHRARYFVNKREAQLEVQPAGMDMLDYIILTFVFAENKRRERESRIHDGGEGRVLKLEA